MEWPQVPSVIESDYRTLYLPAGFILSNMFSPYASDVYVQVHLSGVAVVGLARGHPVIKDNLRVKDINFAVTDGAARNMQTTGKRKRGAARLLPSTNLFEIQCENGLNFMIKCAFKAKLAEVNARALLTKKDPIPQSQHKNDSNMDANGNKKNHKATEPVPTQWTQPRSLFPEEQPLMITDHMFMGHICVLLVTSGQVAYIIKNFITEKEYTHVLKQREAHGGELVSFRKSDLTDAAGNLQDIYAPNESNEGQTWGPGVIVPPKRKLDDKAVQNSESHVQETPCVPENVHLPQE